MIQQLPFVFMNYFTFVLLMLLSLGSTTIESFQGCCHTTSRKNSKNNNIGFVNIKQQQQSTFLSPSSIQVVKQSRGVLLLSSLSSSTNTESTTKQDMTPTTTNTMSELEKEALQYFFTNEQISSIQMEHADGGVSNRMSFITVPMNYNDTTMRYILRIYNNGGNTRVVQFEHEILRQLSNRILSFEIPKALPLRNTDDNKTHIILSNGDEACIFYIIPGILPKLQSTLNIGIASGELHTMMGKLDVPRSMSDQPQYYDIFHVHHAIQSKEQFYNHIASNVFDNDIILNSRNDLNQLVQYVHDMENTIEQLLIKDFPIQLIHGDLHYDNVLIDSMTGSVTGLLDFEYCGFDWRPIELAVCLSKYSSEPDPFVYFNDFIKGYFQTAYLSADEIKSVPDLMILRILSNVVFFVGRTLTGEDEPQQLTKRAAMYNSRIEWINEHRQELIDLITNEMNKNHPTTIST